MNTSEFFSWIMSAVMASCNNPMTDLPALMADYSLPVHYEVDCRLISETRSAASWIEGKIFYNRQAFIFSTAGECADYPSEILNNRYRGQTADEISTCDKTWQDEICLVQKYHVQLYNDDPPSNSAGHYAFGGSSSMIFPFINFRNIYISDIFDKYKSDRATVVTPSKGSDAYVLTYNFPLFSILLHELLHSIGFHAHSPNKYSYMNAVFSEDAWTLEDEIVEFFRCLYKKDIPKLPF